MPVVMFLAPRAAAMRRRSAADDGQADVADRDGEAQPLRPVADQLLGRHTHDLALAVDDGSAAVAGADRRRELDGTGPQGGDHAGREGVLLAEGAADHGDEVARYRLVGRAGEDGERLGNADHGEIAAGAGLADRAGELR